MGQRGHPACRVQVPAHGTFRYNWEGKKAFFLGGNAS